ncbi:MAG TPA: 4a-hydroxytetrahydrobiopterin dehydratase [Acidimicrobiales bacterium]|jgi:4a-hydroxytetrahydrobiopterin dehydratase|nr:4a-hydroxytetrahydrobiopterin dehydratase [Acidimicrobiales bacterium]
MPVLPDDQVRQELADLPGWELDQGQISREYRLDDFRQAVALVVRIAFEAEAANHHPDLDVRYNRVRVALSTHSEGGITAKDIELARAVEPLAAQ